MKMCCLYDCVFACVNYYYLFLSFIVSHANTYIHASVNATHLKTCCLHNCVYACVCRAFNLHWSVLVSVIAIVVPAPSLV